MVMLNVIYIMNRVGKQEQDYDFQIECL